MTTGSLQETPFPIPSSALGKVLIIDDEANLRNTLARVLLQAGCEAASVGDASQALALLAQERFDLVYLDIRLPGIDGLQLLRELRQQYPKLPVILLTGHGSVHSAVEALRLGALDYLLKPVDPALLAARTRAILREQAIERRRREIQEQIAVLQEELISLDQPIDRSDATGSSPETLTEVQLPSSTSARFLTRGRLTLDLQARRLLIEDRYIPLPPASFDYLVVLARYAPDVVDYQKLVTEAQHYQINQDEARELSKWHLHVLRQAIEQNPNEPSLLINVRNVGYRLIVD